MVSKKSRSRSIGEKKSNHRRKPIRNRRKPIRNRRKPRYHSWWSNWFGRKKTWDERVREENYDHMECEEVCQELEAERKRCKRGKGCDALKAARLNMSRRRKCPGTIGIEQGRLSPRGERTAFGTRSPRPKNVECFKLSSAIKASSKHSKAFSKFY